MKQQIKFKQTEIGIIPEDWGVSSLDQIADILTGFPFKGEKYSDKGIRVLRGENVSIGFLRWDTEKRWNHSLEGLNKYYLSDSDIVIGMDGSRVGQNRARVKNSDLPLLLAQRVARLRAKQSVDQKYLYYIIFSDKFFNYVESVRTGTSVPHISSKQIGELKLAVPPITEQQHIAKIFSDLDSKIELNQKMNKTLEAIGKAIFKHWFIDFEFPNEEGQPYKSSGGEMWYNEKLGKEIPKGWRLGCLGDIAENPRRGIQPEAVERGMPYIGLEHMPRQSIALSEWDTIEEVVSNKFQFYRGEILFGKLRPYFHKVGVAAVNGVCSTDILVIVPKLPEWYSFVLYHVSSEDLVNYTNAISTGTRMPRTNWEDMGRYEIVIPTNNVAQVFNDKIFLLVQKICTNILQSRTLATIRDSLLPKLMSGKIRVPVEVR